jgi:hypothetical protein
MSEVDAQVDGDRRDLGAEHPEHSGQRAVGEHRHGERVERVSSMNRIQTTPVAMVRSVRGNRCSIPSHGAGSGTIGGLRRGRGRVARAHLGDHTFASDGSMWVAHSLSGTSGFRARKPDVPAWSGRRSPSTG